MTTASRRARTAGIQAFLFACAGIAGTTSACGSCDKDGGTGLGGRAGPASDALEGGGGAVVAEALPRCRPGNEKLALGAEDVMVGDVAIGPSGILVGFVRTEAGKRVASVLRASLDLATTRIVDIGPAVGDDPPPSPRWNGAAAYVASIGPHVTDAGPRLRALRVAELGEQSLGRAYAPILQQMDESTAFDVAFSESGVLATWDEDAPAKEDAAVPVASERGFVKVQLLAPSGSDPSPRRVASPETSDAESPRVIARPSGFWLAWLARRSEADEHLVEGPGERRAFRWVEAIALDAKGEPAGPVRRVTPEKGRAATFELAARGGDLIVVVQDDAAPSEGAGARVARYRVPADAANVALESADIVDGGVGQSLAELVPVSAAPAPPPASPSTAPPDVARWLAWSDTSERTQMTPLGPGLTAAGRTSQEPALDGARVLAHAPPDGIYALVFGEGKAGGSASAARGRPELRRFSCR